MTVSSISRQQPHPTHSDCGICDVPHRCHCPRLKAWCDNCPALGQSLPEASYQRVIGLTLQGIVAATAYRRRLALKAVS